MCGWPWFWPRQGQPLGLNTDLRKPSKADDGQERPGKSIATANHYLTGIKGFTRWLWRDRRISTDPPAGLAKLANGDTETDIRHARREFAAEELQWLLDVTRSSARLFRGLTGASPKTAPTLARHATVQLTLGRYAHAALFDLTAAVDAMPPLLPAGPNTEALAATGTDGRQISLGLNLVLRRDVLGDSERQAETEPAKDGKRKNPGKQAILAVFQGSASIVNKIAASGFEPLTSRL